MRLQAAVSLWALAEVGFAADSPRPRGVSPEFAKFYSSADTFTCISNPAVQIPRSRLNDDFCDCPDGSDEPGTSACAHLSYDSIKTGPRADVANYNNTLALPGFYCKNKGHNPSYVPFTHVNDGVCDYTLCCDGSDEWAQVGGTKCEDRCKTIGEEWRKLDAQRQISLTAAGKARIELIREAAKKRKEISDYLESSKAGLAGLEVRVKQMEKEKSEIEKSEKSKVVRKQGKGGKSSVLAGLAKVRLGHMRDSIGYLKRQRDDQKTRLAELEGILSTFKVEFNPNFNDEGVKRAVRAWDDYAARDKAGEEEARERDADEQVNGGDGIPWEDFENDTAEGLAGDIETLYAFEEYLPAFLKEWLDGQLRSLRQMLVDNGILPPTDVESTANETPAVKEATERLTLAQNDLNDMESKRKQHSEDLDKDYGADDVFRTLDKKCISTDSGEYTYEMCFLGAVTQKPKKGGMDNNMGHFARFDKVVVDEDTDAQGRGLGRGERLAMRFENGAGCWQGPSRSTTVIMACYEKDELWKIMEEEKCVYRMEIGTPAVCQASKAATADGAVGADPGAGAGAGGKKEEL